MKPLGGYDFEVGNLKSWILKLRFSNLWGIQGAQLRPRASTQKTQPEASYWPSGAGDEVEEIMKELKRQAFMVFPKKGIHKFISEKHIQLNVWLHQIHESPLGIRDRKVEC